jgi:hypothetical protein
MCPASQAQQSPQHIGSVWPLAVLSSVAVRMPQGLSLMAQGIMRIAMNMVKEGDEEVEGEEDKEDVMSLSVCFWKYFELSVFVFKGVFVS